MTAKLTQAQEKALDIRHSVCVTASAGTGKTFILKERYIKLLRENPTLDPERILCLTFTDKAAAEMRDRIQSEIRKLAKTDEKLNHVLPKIHKCSIGTFHGFCAAILKEFPIEAQVPVGFAIMDDLDKQDLVAKTIADTLENPPESIRNDVTFLHIHSKNPEPGVSILLKQWDGACREWFARFDRHPEKLFAFWKDIHERRLCEAYDDFVSCKEIAEMMEELDRNPNTTKTGAELCRIYNRKKTISAVMEKCSFLNEICSIKYSNTKKSGVSANLNAVFISKKKMVREIVDLFQYNSADDKAVKLMADVLQAYGHTVEHIHKKIVAKKERENKLDFNDLIAGALRLIENESAGQTLRGRFKYILVDEVQDNDPALTKIVEYLAGDPKNSDRLFIVGDIKQSIYGFKGAKPNEILELSKRFSSREELDTNFRTVDAVMCVINSVFAEIFTGDENQVISYSGVKTHRSEQIGSVKLISNEYQDGEKTEKYLAAEAKMIAAWIHDSVLQKNLIVYDGEKNNAGPSEDTPYRPADYRDFAILVGTRTHNDKLKNALSLYSVPFYELKGRNFYDSQEIFDFLNVMKACVFTEDDTALYGALHSSYFGISDEELCRAAFPPVCEIAYPTLRQKLALSENKDIRNALILLDQLSVTAAARPLGEFLNEIITRTGIESVYAALDDGPGKLANLEKLIGIGKSRSLSSGISVFEFIRIIDTSIAAKIDEEEGIIAGDAENRVKIMTIHASKGLEFPVVILAFGGREDTSPNTDQVKFDEEYGAAVPSLTLPGDDKEIFKMVKNAISEKKKAREADEHLRMFYVAMTRARDHLVLSESHKASSEPEKRSFYAYFKKWSGSKGVETISKCVCDPPSTAGCDTDILIPEGWECICVEQSAALGPADEAGEPDVQDYILKRGSCVHEIFAGADVDETCRKYGFGSDAELMRGQYARFMNSDLMNGAERSWCEIPLRCSDGRRRVVDRLVRFSDGRYLIVDYKNGSLAHLEEGLREKYVKQLSEYSQVLGEVLGIGSVPAVLYFITDEGICTVVE